MNISVAFEPGSLLANRYQVVKPLGAGSMGTIVLGRDLNDNGKEVALKFLHSNLVKDHNMFVRFQNEVLFMRELNHENVVKTYDFRQLGENIFYLTMDYVDGKTLSDLIEEAEGQRMDFQQGIDVLCQIAMGLGHAHSKQVIHRDLKPDNVLVGKDGIVKVTDFGLAKTLLLDSNLTGSQETVGTPFYMAPEQFLGDNLDQRGDIYSFGILAYEVFVGEKPFVAQNYMELAKKHIQEPLPIVPAKELGLPKWISNFLIHCSRKEPVERFQSFDEILNVLLCHYSKSEQVAGTGRDFKRWKRRAFYRKLFGRGSD